MDFEEQKEPEYRIRICADLQERNERALESMTFIKIPSPAKRGRVRVRATNLTAIKPTSKQQS
jgi:hypothetical protein